MKKLKHVTTHVVLFAVLLFYCFILVRLTLFKYITLADLFDPSRLFVRTANLIPIKGTILYFNGNISFFVACANVFGNIALFIPLGIYVHLFRKNKGILSSVIFVMLISIGIETVQYIFGIGATDIDDVILNTLGGFIGVLVYKFIALLVSDEHKNKPLIAYCSLFVALLSIPVFGRYYPQMFMVEKRTEIIVVGGEYAVNDMNADVIAEFISYDNGLITARNIPGINNRVDKFGDEIITAWVDTDTRLARKTIEYLDMPDRTVVTYEPLTVEELSHATDAASISFNVDTSGEKWIAWDICVSYLK